MTGGFSFLCIRIIEELKEVSIPKISTLELGGGMSEKLEKLKIGTLICTLAYKSNPVKKSSRVIDMQDLYLFFSLLTLNRH